MDCNSKFLRIPVLGPPSSGTQSPVSSLAHNLQHNHPFHEDESNPPLFLEDRDDEPTDFDHEIPTTSSTFRRRQLFAEVPSPCSTTPSTSPTVSISDFQKSAIASLGFNNNSRHGTAGAAAGGAVDGLVGDRLPVGSDPDYGIPPKLVRSKSDMSSLECSSSRVRKFMWCGGEGDDRAIKRPSPMVKAKFPPSFSLSRSLDMQPPASSRFSLTSSLSMPFLDKENRGANGEDPEDDVFTAIPRPASAPKQQLRKGKGIKRMLSVSVNNLHCNPQPVLVPSILPLSCPSSPSPRCSAALPPPPPCSITFPSEKKPSLPLVTSKDGLNRVSVATVNEVLDGLHTKNYSIVDCRFEFEYEGGHIRQAVNIKTFEQLEHRFLQHIQDQVLIFHCEFSSHRAPNMFKHLRNRDRDIHKDSYPSLHYPEMYIIDGGYKKFFEHFPDKCTPREYVTMDDPNFEEERKKNMRAVRTKSSKVRRSFSVGCIADVANKGCSERSLSALSN